MKKPSDVLRKTIILGLGNLDEQESTEVIFEQFHSEREEIQIAVLDALQTSTRYESIQFLANIMMARERSQTLEGPNERRQDDCCVVWPSCHPIFAQWPNR